MAIFNWPVATTTSGPVQFNLNGSITTVNKDTVTPANTLALPVEIQGTSGPINITAGDLNVQLAHSGANYDSTRIGDGTNLLGITASNEAKISAASLPLPTGAATETTLSTLNTKIPSSLTVTATRLLVDGSGVTQPVSAASLPLPTGAATEATSTAISGKLPATLGQKTMAASMAVAIASDQSNLPANLAQIAGVATSTGNGVAGTGVQRVTIASDNTPYPIKIDQTTIGTTNAVSIAQLGANAVATGNGIATAGTLRVALASDTTSNTNPLLFKQAGKSQANAPIRNDYTSTSVTTGAYVQLVAALTSACTELEIFDSSGQTLYLATGAAASEVNQIIIFPGGNGRIPLAIPAGTRIAIKAISATANVGEIDINFYS